MVINRGTMGQPVAIAVFDIDGVVRDVSGSYRRAIADTVEHYTAGQFRPSPADIDTLKSEGLWNNDWKASAELVYRFFEGQGRQRQHVDLEYDALVTFFQQRYRGVGDDPAKWQGYITQEPLLMSADYLNQLTAANIAWAFFSGATRGSAHYVLQHRMGLSNPILIAMEDAPSKPDPTGLMRAVTQVEQQTGEQQTGEQQTGEQACPVIYIGDTVADMQTVVQARVAFCDRSWHSVGVLPPHVQTDLTYQKHYAAQLTAAGADILLGQVTALTPAVIKTLSVSPYVVNRESH